MGFGFPVRVAYLCHSFYLDQDLSQPMEHTSRLLLLLFVLSIDSSSCVLVGSTDPEEDNCTSGRQTSTSPLGQEFILDSTRPDHFFQTSVPVDINCHGKFAIEVFYKDVKLRYDSTAVNPVDA